jgi:hypothetical protein
MDHCHQAYIPGLLSVGHVLDFITAGKGISGLANRFLVAWASIILGNSHKHFYMRFS